MERELDGGDVATIFWTGGSVVEHFDHISLPSARLSAVISLFVPRAP